MEEKILSVLAIIQGDIARINNQINEMNNQFNGINSEITGIKQEIREIRNQQFLFEQEYGNKIDAIFDSVSLEIDKNLEKSEKIGTLGKRMDRSEAMMFSHEKRISKLEFSK